MYSGQYLKNLILSQNLSIRAFSEKSMISYDLICNAIHGKTKSPKVLAKIAKALNIEPESIIDVKNLKTTINTFNEINSNDGSHDIIQDIIKKRLEFYKIDNSNILIKKIAHAIFYYIKQAGLSDENIIEYMIDAVILYGIMESKIKEKE
jgi:transcriptional regulator with XRE-family HTH domain